MATFQDLKDSIEALRASEGSASELMKLGRAAGWDGPGASEVLDALKACSAEDLVPHLEELATTLLPGRIHAMGCLDVIAAAGPAGFATVAKEVHAHFGAGDDPYVIELLGKVGDFSAEATTIFRQGLKSDDADVFDYTVGAIRAHTGSTGARALLDDVRRRLEEDFEEPDQRYALIGLIGQLGGDDLEAQVRRVLDQVDGDGGFRELLTGLRGLDLGSSPLAPLLLARLRTMKPDGANTFNAVDALVKLGIEDRAFMVPVALAFSKKGEMWAARAEPMLARWA